MSNDTAKRPTISFRTSRDLKNTLDTLANQAGTTRGEVLETLVTKGLGNQVQKKSALDTPADVEKNKKPETVPTKTVGILHAYPDKKGWFDFLLDDDDRAAIAARLEKKGSFGRRVDKAIDKAIDRAAADPVKLVADTEKGLKAMKAALPLAALAAILAPVLIPYVKAQLAKMKKAKAAAAQTMPATATSPKIMAEVVSPGGLGLPSARADIADSLKDMELSNTLAPTKGLG